MFERVPDPSEGIRAYYRTTSAYKWAQDQIRTRPVHGSEIEERAPGQGETLIRCLVADGVAHWYYPAPTHSQRAFSGLTYGSSGKYWRECLDAKAAGFAAMWMLR